MSSKTGSLKGNMTEGAILPKILLFSLPIIATGILQLLFNTADTVVVGRWGGSTPDECETALAAVGSCSSLINLLVNFFNGLSVGVGVCAAKAIGMGNSEKVSRVAHTSVLTALFSGLFVCAFGILFAPQFLLFMGTPAAVLEEAVPYIRAYLLGAPANMVYSYCASLLRADGDAKRPLIFLSSAGVLNVGLNLIMVLIFHMGAIGVGIATAAAQWASCVMILIYLCKNKGLCKISLRNLKIHKAEFYEIIYIGIPAGLQSALFSISNVIIQSAVNSFDNKTVVAAAAAANNLTGYTYITTNAFYHVMLTVAGQNNGAGRFDRLKKSLFYSLLCVLVIGLMMGFGELAIGRTLLSVYMPNNESAIEVGLQVMQIELTTYFLCGMMEVGSAFLRAMGRSILSMVISLAGACISRILWIFTVFVYHHTIVVLFLAYPVSWFLTASVMIVLSFVILKKEEQYRTSR